MTLTTDKLERKTIPLFSGLLKYFPKALAEVAHVSWVGNEQHNPGQPLHWDRSKSTDEPDALMRHLMEAGTIDVDGCRHSAKVAWRALAMLEKEIEADELDTRRAREQQAALQNHQSHKGLMESQSGCPDSLSSLLGGAFAKLFCTREIDETGRTGTYPA